jgi:putative intracellular protease/amidase
MIVFLLPSADYDPTEACVVWRSVKNAGYKVLFASPDGNLAYGDSRLTKTGFGLLNPFLMTGKLALKTYEEMITSEEFRNIKSFSEIDIKQIQGIFVPGGHDKKVRTLLESKIAQDIILEGFKRNLPIGAVCHGVLLLARTIDPVTNKSVLHGRKTTSLTNMMEMTAWNLTRAWLGDYYRTYPESVESEVKSALAGKNDYIRGPLISKRDTESNKNGFTVRDGNYISARWPGDCYTLADRYVDLLNEYYQKNI